MTKSIKKYDFKEGLPQEFEILELKQLITNFKEEAITPHRVDFYQIIWFTKGNVTHMIDFNPIPIKPNTLLFINKNSVHQFDKSYAFDGKTILFTDSFFCKEETDAKFLKSTILFNDLLTTSSVFISNTTDLFKTIIQLIEIEQQNEKDNYQSEIIRNLLRNFLFLAERERKKQNFIEINKGADLDIVMLFKGLLEQQFQKEKQVINYANQLFITKKRLNTATSKVLGLTPKQIIDAQILLEAKRLLAHTNDSVKEISFNLGFEESTNFIKYFRKHENVTPIEFRTSFTS